MRTSTVLAMVMVLLAVPACKNLRNVPPRTTTGCVPKDGDAKTCKNMLRRDWENDPEATLLFVSDAARLPLKSSPVERDRKTDIDCRNTNQSNKKLRISYSAPVEMDNFPSDGTGDRDLVVAVLESKGNSDCREARYGILKPKGGNPRPDIVYFITVKTIKGNPINSGVDRQIGEWKAWAIYKKNGQYVLDDLRQGAYVQCGHPHNASYADVAFTTCDKAKSVPAPPVTGLLDRFFTIRSANASTATGSVSAMQEFLSEEVDPAWGRCGALGCCASY